jgi:hypothetical protein
VLSEDHAVAADGKLPEIITNDDLLLKVNLIHEHAHRHGDTAHVHRHGHYGHYHSNGGIMHDNHKHHSHGDGHDHDHAETEILRKQQMMIEHWIEHSDSHAANYAEWAAKASQAGEEEVSREIHLAIDDSEAVKKHLKRAHAILAAKLVLRK